MAEKKVVIYSLPTWPHCKKAKEYLSQKNISFHDHDVSVDKEALKDMVEKTKQLGVPVLIIDDKDILIGFDSAKLDDLLSPEKKKE